MLYVKRFTVPKNTPRESPFEVKINIYEKYLTRVGIFFPPGPLLLVGVAVFYGEEQLFPHREGDWVIGDDIYIESEVEYKAPEYPWTIRVLAYNEDQVYDHTVVVYLSTRNYLLRDVFDELARTIKAMFSPFATLRPVKRFTVAFAKG